MVRSSALRWDRHFLPSFAARVVADLPPAFEQAFSRSSHVSWGSSCSGTESPLWVFEALSQNNYLTHTHVFSAEIDPDKRSWIQHITQATRRVRRKRAHHTLLFCDILDVSRPSATCANNGVVAPADYCEDLDLFLAGFSCKDVSFLNVNRGSASECTETHSGTTGGTFLGVKLIVEMRRPKAFILENVVGLLVKGQIYKVVEQLEAKGYIVIWRVQNQRNPASRKAETASGLWDGDWMLLVLLRSWLSENRWPSFGMTWCTLVCLAVDKLSSTAFPT